MQILQHTDEHTPTLMRDVFEALIGKKVVINTNGPMYQGGTLDSYNGHVIKLTGCDGMNTYVMCDRIVSISSADDKESAY